LAHRLLLIYLLSFVSVIVLAYSLIVEKNIAIDFARKEQRGSAYAAVVRDALLAVVEDHLASASPAAAPDADNRASLKDHANKILSADARFTDVPAEYDAGINRGLGVPASFYHFAFEAGSEASLEGKRDELRAKGVEVTDIFDHHWSKSIYFKDPNGLSLEYCCMVRNLTEEDATMAGLYTVPRAALDLRSETSVAVSEAQSVRGRRKARTRASA
jgi:catechol 2,3-dioxygenase-like lactoylglutathione lyase family enzyme